MTPRLRALAAKDVLHAPAGFGFEVVSTSGSHAKLRRVTASGEAQVSTIPLHRDLARETLHAIFRQVCRFVPEKDFRPFFFG